MSVVIMISVTRVNPVKNYFEAVERLVGRFLLDLVSYYVDLKPEVF